MTRLSGYSDTHTADASMTAIDGADTLLGGDGNDTLIIGHGDTATGGAGADRFEIEHQWADGTAAATITDYSRPDRPSGTALHAAFRRQPRGNHRPLVTVDQSPDAIFTAISLDGVVVANVMGSRAVGLAEVVLVREE